MSELPNLTESINNLRKWRKTATDEQKEIFLQSVQKSAEVNLTIWAALAPLAQQGISNFIHLLAIIEEMQEIIESQEVLIASYHLIGGENPENLPNGD